MEPVVELLVEAVELLVLTSEVAEAPQAGTSQFTSLS